MVPEITLARIFSMEASSLFIFNAGLFKLNWFHLHCSAVGTGKQCAWEVYTHI